MGIIEHLRWRAEMGKLCVDKCKLAIVGGTVIMAALLVGKTDVVKAGVVKANGSTDSYNIQQELNETGSVTLEEGSTYILYDSLVLSSNMSIEAEGATIICEKPIAFNIPEKTDYKAAADISINGGIWKSETDGYYASSFKFTHASNIKLTNMKIRAANLSGHSIELVACKDVVIDKCDIAGLGSSDSMTEEAVQIDIASSVTAPFLGGSPFRTDLADKLWNKAGCKNITIKNSKIVGNRGVVANHTKNDGDAINSIHENITLTNNKITGLKGEGVVLFNTKSATVKNNKIKSLRKGIADAYTVGLHITTFSNDKALNKAVFKISGNTIHGGRQALMVYSHSGIKFGKAIIEKNKFFCKAGKEQAIHAKEQSVRSVVVKSNNIKAYREKE